MGAALSFSGDSCDRSRRYLPVHSFFVRHRRRPRRASSSSPIMPTAMASTSAWPRARSAARPQPAPIADHVILRRPQPFVASTPMKSRVRCRKRVQIARAAAATNMSPSPASGNGKVLHTVLDKVPATPAPRKRRDAAARSGYVEPPQPRGPGRMSLMAGYA
jgi:hypothetical protein